MKRYLLDALMLAALAGLVWLLWQQTSGPPEPPPLPAPMPAPPPPPPAPCPPDRPCPPRPRALGLGTDIRASVGGPRNADGTEIDCDLPLDFHVKNRGGSDGAGLCVFASLRHTGLWHDEPVLAGLFEWMFTRPGGGYPAKVDKMVEAYCQGKGLPRPAYIQVEGSDLEVLKAACASGRMPGVTYWQSPTGRYGGKRIAHMVSLVAASDRWFTVLDNNYPGTYEWMSPEEFRRAYTGGTGKGWAVIPLKPSPPPVPFTPTGGNG